MKQMNQFFARYRLAGATFWAARSDQERKMLSIGGMVLLLALFYSILIDPALSGRAALRKSLPELRQEAASIEALARQAADLKRQAPPPVPPMTRASLTSGLTTRGLTAQSVSMTGEYAKLQFSGVPFAALMAWLDAMRRESRIGVQDAAMTALPAAGMVDATVTLHQSGGAAK